MNKQKKVALNAGATAEDVIPRLLRAFDIRTHYVPVSLDTLDSWVSLGQFPKPDLKTGRERLWAKDTVEAWFRNVVAKGEL